MSRRVAITGVSGFIGRHVAARLQRAGWAVTGVLRPDSRRPPPDGISCVRARLAGADLQRPIDGADVVIHLAGIVRGSRDGDFHAVNVDATGEVATAAARAGAHLVHVSSLAAAGPGVPSAPRTEDAPPRPITPYGRSKLAGEAQVRQTAGLQWTILRPVAVYGPGDTAFLPLFRCARRGWFPVAGAPDTAYTLIHVDDLARAIETAASTSAGRGEIFFVGAEPPVTVRVLLETLAGSLKRAYRPRRVPEWLLRTAAGAGQLSARLGYPASFDRSRLAEVTAGGFVCSVKKAEALLGFRAEIDLADGIARTAAWYAREGWL